MSITYFRLVGDQDRKARTALQLTMKLVNKFIDKHGAVLQSF